MPLPSDFLAELRKRFTGDIRPDLGSRVLYSTDASIYQVEPLAVVTPRTQDDLHAAVELAAKYRLPILPRGAGTSLAGQAIGEALILDCSRWLDQIVGIDPEARTATVEPGVILAALNRAAAQHGLTFGPDPASAERATLGGVVGNNATGAHSILYGMTADHLRSADIIMADGSLATLGEIDLREPATTVEPSSSETLISRFSSAALEIREQHAEAIRAHFPQTWRNSAGYRLNYLLPWSASQPSQWSSAQVPGTSGYPPVAEGRINLSALLAGSEGTLAVMRHITLNLVPKPAHTALGVLAYPSLAEACDDVPRLLTHHPSAVELIPQMLIRLARGIPAYARQAGWVEGDPAALLVIEFSGEDPPRLAAKARACGDNLRVVTNPSEQDQIWSVRKAGLGILDAAPVAARPVAFVEDCAVPVERLGDFVREVERILVAYDAQAAFYAHASAGCLHIRPMLDLRTGHGVRSLRSIAEQVLALTLRLGGGMSSEHGDGLARSEWIAREVGDELVDAMRTLKQAADPQGILNPGKILDPAPMDSQLRFGADQKATAWKTPLDLSRAGGLRMAIEQCNGQGVCRKFDGVMCPSFQATRDEKHSTRGRANLLRALISAPVTGRMGGELGQATAEALDLCLACKGCKAECPSGVDMAKLKFAFEAEYYRTHRRPLSDYLFGYFHLVGQALAPVAPLANFVTGTSALRRLIARSSGIAPERPFPKFSAHRARAHRSREGSRERILYLSDSFTRYIDPEVEQAALDVLDTLGFEVLVLPIVGAGAALLSKGFVEPARRHAARLLDGIRRLDPEGSLPVVGIEPPEIYTLKNDYLELLPQRSDEIVQRAARTWLLDELIVRSKRAQELLRADWPQPLRGRIKFQPHCHQRAEAPRPDGLPNGPGATVAMLELCDYEVEIIDAGCCGMAGTFGYEARHYELSQKIAELRLFPQVRERGDAGIASTGAACRLQIVQGTGVAVQHPVQLVASAIRPGGRTSRP